MDTLRSPRYASASQPMSNREPNTTPPPKRGKRRLLWSATLLTIIAGIIWLTAGFEREPTYQGKSASYWLDYSAEPSSSSWVPDPTFEAFQALGIKAVPFLIKITKHRPSRLLVKFDAFLDQHDLPMGDWLKKRLPNLDQIDERRLKAMNVLGRLGPRAASAIPALAQVLSDPDEDEQTRWEATEALESMGEAALVVLPQLVANLKSTNDDISIRSANILEKIGPKASSAVPGLRSATQSADQLALASAKALLSIEHDTNILIQVCSNLLSSSQYDMRASALSSLAPLGETAKSISPAVQAALRDAVEDVRWEAEATLKKIDSEALRMIVRQINQDIPGQVSQSITVLKAGDPRRVSGAARALAVIGPKAAAAVPALIELLHEEPPSANDIRARVQYSRMAALAAVALAEIGPDARAAVPLMSDALKRKPLYLPIDCYCKALGAIGPEAQAAVPALEDLLADRSPDTQLAAAEALSRIAPGQSSNAVVVLRQFQAERSLNPPGFPIDSSKFSALRAHWRSESAAASVIYIDSSKLSALRAQVALWRLHFESQPVDSLTELCKSSDKILISWDQRLIDLLGDIGPEARSALPLLEDCLEKDPEQRLAAAIAIRKIDPDEYTRLGLPGTLAIP